ncbi:MAG: S49 family peptidase, partial [Flavobacteriales bacterium]|nr:S49 family peptidase [Flavobacteriales bacterium]
MNFGKQFLASLLGSTLAMIFAGSVLIFIFVGALVGGLTSALAEGGGDLESEFEFGVDIEEGSVLHLTFDAPMAERGMEVPFTIGFGSLEPQTQMGLNHFLSDMERAAEDDRIDGILLQADMISGYPSMLGEVRDALAKFKASGKWVVAWSEIYTQGAYWMSSVADEVYLHPEGGIDMRGMGMETTFYKRMLEDLGVEMTIVRGPDNAYKSAVEPYLRESLSEANREQLTALLEDFWARMGGDIAMARGMSVAELDGHINGLTMRSPRDAQELGFVDGLLYEDELHAMLLEKGAAEDEDEESHALLVGYNQYHNPDFFEDFITTIQLEMDGGDEEEEDEAPEGEANAVAVVFAVGAIESGQGDDATIGSERIAGALREARLDPEVGAVVLRVNSPGGSALASDVIWRETVLLKEAGKPVVASMSDLAASGGYYISCAADHIMAQPNTITGSIGVFGVLPSAGKLMRER